MVPPKRASGSQVWVLRAEAPRHGSGKRGEDALDRVLIEVGEAM